MAKKLVRSCSHFILANVLLLLMGAGAKGQQEFEDGLDDTVVNNDNGLIDQGVLGAIEQEQNNEGDQQHVFTVDHIASFGSDVPLEIQSLRALQELGVVLAVAFMVALIFLLMMAVERLAAFLRLAVDRLLGRETPIDEMEDPAALVGTFKRYKN